DAGREADRAGAVHGQLRVVGGAVTVQVEREGRRARDAVRSARKLVAIRVFGRGQRQELGLRHGVAIELDDVDGAARNDLAAGRDLDVQVDEVTSEDRHEGLGARGALDNAVDARSQLDRGRAVDG